MLNNQSLFDNQSLTVLNAYYHVQLSFVRDNLGKQELRKIGFDHEIQITDSDDWTSILAIEISKRDLLFKRVLVTGIVGGCYLHIANDEDKGQSVKLDGRNLILSLGVTLISINLKSATVEWMISPDMAEIFEFYDLGNDILLRGELAIYRIDKSGQVKWSYGGRDIWVNIDGRNEVTIMNDKIVLIDFQSNEYWINYEGGTIKDLPVRK
jgi:hypothetical protein